MATIYADIQGIDLMDSHLGARHAARIRLTNAAGYTAASDNLSVGGGGKLFGAATSASLESIIASVRRDGKAVDVIGGVGCGVGKAGATDVFIDTIAESSGNLTGEFANASSTEINVSAGAMDVPAEIFVIYDLA
jgi:hypothetical protein